MIDELKEEDKNLDYLQVFKVRKCEEGIVIEHSQEVPKYKEKYVLVLKEIYAEKRVEIGKNLRQLCEWKDV